MLERAKWLTIMITIAGLIMGAQALFEHIISVPAMEIDPTSTVTLTPTQTVASTSTTEPKRTEPSNPGIMITEFENGSSGNGFTGEYVVIKNTRKSAVYLTDWTLRDDQKNIFTFPAYELGAGKSVKIWTRVGVNTTDNLYWNLDTEVWNIGGDCGYLRDSQGNLQSYICY